MAYEADFEQWWSGCWLKIGKLAAKKEYDMARRSHGATAAELLLGRDVYRANKPSWQAWVHPKTWLHQGRWMDDYSRPAPLPHQPSGDYDWFIECKALHNGECELSKSRHDQRKQMDAFRAKESA